MRRERVDNDGGVGLSNKLQVEIGKIDRGIVSSVVVERFSGC